MKKDLMIQIAKLVLKHEDQLTNWRKHSVLHLWSEQRSRVHCGDATPDRPSDITIQQCLEAWPSSTSFRPSEPSKCFSLILDANLPDETCASSFDAPHRFGMQLDASLFMPFLELE